ncbi:DUF397 domain-containing protein [Micromonospora sp. WMMD1102]|uniref:DUF397 domain-containing protein n=1 Tax=Micromonospora sp. WMMD1102 TaxID=3016105 RepID=UPI002415005E|nr:DUF397 domain-containing protein [Micromonospora sp. WMMD1102]MDG4785937.1 DUF397 domain-containing protein [Micromonospora sp. WMMD1102]
MLTDQWRKSTRSGGNGACVEARYPGHTAEVRDSKDTGGPVLAFTPAAWRAFVASAGTAPRQP